MVRKSQILIFALLFSILLVTCSSRQLNLKVDILDSSFFSPLFPDIFLTVENSNKPGTRLLIPINDQQIIITKNTAIKIPLKVKDGDTIIFELLNERTLLKDNVLKEKFQNVFESVGSLVWHWGKLYAVSKDIKIAVLMTKADDEIEAILEGSGELLIEYMSKVKFKHLGSREYYVPKCIPQSVSTANPLTIIHSNNKAQIDMRIYFKS